jgi:hypothetical protein
LRFVDVAVGIALEKLGLALFIAEMTVGGELRADVGSAPDSRDDQPTDRLRANDHHLDLRSDVESSLVALDRPQVSSPGPPVR